jgi:hypothetical protein
MGPNPGGEGGADVDDGALLGDGLKEHGFTATQHREHRVQFSTRRDANSAAAGRFECQRRVHRTSEP